MKPNKQNELKILKNKCSEVKESITCIKFCSLEPTSSNSVNVSGKSTISLISTRSLGFGGAKLSVVVYNDLC